MLTVQTDYFMGQPRWIRQLVEEAVAFVGCEIGDTNSDARIFVVADGANPPSRFDVPTLTFEQSDVDDDELPEVYGREPANWTAIVVPFWEVGPAAANEGMIYDAVVDWLLSIGRDQGRPGAAAADVLAARLLDELGSLLREKDALQQSYAEALGDLEQARLRIEMLERELAQLRDSGRVADTSTRRSSWGATGQRVAGLLVALAIGAVSGYAGAAVQADATVKAAEIQAKATVAAAKDQDSAPDRLVEQVIATSRQLVAECADDDG